MNIQELPEARPLQRAAASRIELLHAALVAANKGATDYESEFGADAFFNDYCDDYCDETAAIYEALAVQKPKTLHEAAIMLRACLHYHFDMLLTGTAENEDEKAYSDRGAKVERILKAVCAVLPNPEEPLEAARAGTEKPLAIAARARNHSAAIEAA